MCNVEEDIEDISKFSLRLQNKTVLENRNLLKCKKCDSRSVVLLQKKDPFCRQCFFEYSTHKFRSTIGKSKKIKHGDKVLLACSGGRKSTALLHMTKDALDSATAKQISFIPEILFIEESISTPLDDEGKNQVHGILNELKSYGYPLLYSSLEMVCNLNGNQPIFWNFDKQNSINDFKVSSDSKNCIRESMEDMSLSAKIDFIKHIRLLLITEIANRSGFKHVFVGDTSCSLAENLLTGINLGRGSQISSDTNFFDTRYKVSVCRPLREFLNKEVAVYLHLHNCSYTVLPDLLTKTDTKSSIQRLSESFITNLQEDFPATVFTIFRTGGKLSKQDGICGSKICLLCRSKLDNVEPDPCSALEALKISQKLSLPPNDILSNSPSGVVSNDLSSPQQSDLKNENLLKFLCHGCSVAFRNIKRNSKFDPFLRRMERNEMKEEIQDFLINSECEAL